MNIVKKESEKLFEAEPFDVHMEYVLSELSVAAHFGFTYRQHEEDGMREYLRMVREYEC